MKKTNLYNDVIKNGLCVRSGAYAVVNEKIKMKMNKFGEYEPIADSLNEFNDPKVAFVCSIYNSDINEDDISKELFSSIKSIKYDKNVGYYRKLYAGHVIEGDFRKNASSGGIATWVFKELLTKKMIDGVIHVKESDDGDGILFKYKISKTIKEVCDGAKTKYYPVEFSQVLDIVRKKPGKYAIIGIPSFIMEIRLLTKQDKIFNERIVYTIGLICGHQKSAKYAESLAWQCGIKPGDLKYINFRKKLDNKPSNKYATEMTGIVDGKEINITKKQEELFGTNWGCGFFKTKFSDYTDDAMNETADISIGDAWIPEYTKNCLGDNIVIVRNEEIYKLIEKGIKTNKLHLDEISLSDVTRSQKGLIHHYKDEIGFRLYKEKNKGNWIPATRSLPSNKIPYLRKLTQELRILIAKKSQKEYQISLKYNQWIYFKNKMKKYISIYNLLYNFQKIKGNGIIWAIKKLF